VPIRCSRLNSLRPRRVEGHDRGLELLQQLVSSTAPVPARSVAEGPHTSASPALPPSCLRCRVAKTPSTAASRRYSPSARRSGPSWRRCPCGRLSGCSELRLPVLQGLDAVLGRLRLLGNQVAQQLGCLCRPSVAPLTASTGSGYPVSAVHADVHRSASAFSELSKPPTVECLAGRATLTSFAPASGHRRPAAYSW